MSVAVSQDLARSQNVAEVFSGRQARAIRPQSSSTEKPLLPDLPQGNGIKSSAAVISLLDESRQSAGQTAYDQPAPQYQKAVDAYKSFASAKQREEIQQYFSVDLFA
ncbi:MAG: hypothetical protein ACK4NN_02225 [Rheinheimera sp.]|jgi:hypothetical protein